MNKKASVLFASFLFVVGMAMASVGFYPGGSQFHLQGSNAEVNISMEKNFSSVAVYSEALELDARNFSVQNYSSDNLSTSLKAWDPSAGSGEDMVVLNASASAGTFQLGLEGFAADTNFTLLRDGAVQRYLLSDSSGNMNFNYTGGTVRNFTVRVTNFAPSVSLSLGSTSVKQGSSIGITCQASDSDGISKKTLKVHGPDSSYDLNCGEKFSNTDKVGTYSVNFSATDTKGKTSLVSKSFEVTSEEETVSSTGSRTNVLALGGKFVKRWDSVYRNEFEVQHQAIGKELEAVSFKTVRRAQNLELQVQEFSQRPEEVASLQDAYSYVSLEVKGLMNNEISNASLRFSVNSSFATSYDRIRGMHFNNGAWEKLPTELVQQGEEENIYQIDTDGFSYFAVSGENNEEKENVTGGEEETNRTQPIDDEPLNETNSTEPEKGLNESEGQTASDNSQKVGRLKQIAVILAAAVFLLLLVLSWRRLVSKSEKKTEDEEEEPGDAGKDSDKQEGSAEESDSGGESDQEEDEGADSGSEDDDGADSEEESDEEEKDK